VQTVPPRHPGAPVAPDSGGKAVVDFLVDEQGTPRMPVVLSSTHELFGEAAVDAISRWRFQPPTCGGRPVVVRVSQEFVFPGRS
jgi:TonB family protein